MNEFVKNALFDAVSFKDVQQTTPSHTPSSTTTPTCITSAIETTMSSQQRAALQAFLLLTIVMVFLAGFGSFVFSSYRRLTTKEQLLPRSSTSFVTAYEPSLDAAPYSSKHSASTKSFSDQDDSITAPVELELENVVEKTTHFKIQIIPVNNISNRASCAF